jgi:hypothetical protein
MTTPTPDIHNVEQSQFVQDWLAAFTREYLEPGDRDWDAFKAVTEAIQEVTQLHQEPHWESGGGGVVPPDDSVMGYWPGEDNHPRPRRSWGGR